MAALDIIILVLALVAVSFPLTAAVNIIKERVEERAWEEGFAAGAAVGHIEELHKTEE